MNTVTFGNDTGNGGVRVRAEPIISIGDLPRNSSNLWVRTAINGWGVIKEGVLVDVDISTVPKPIIDVAKTFEETNQALKFPYALFLEQVDV